MLLIYFDDFSEAKLWKIYGSWLRLRKKIVISILSIYIDRCKLDLEHLQLRDIFTGPGWLGKTRRIYIEFWLMVCFFSGLEARTVFCFVF